MSVFSIDIKCEMFWFSFWYIQHTSTEFQLKLKEGDDIGPIALRYVYLLLRRIAYQYGQT